MKIVFVTDYFKKSGLGNYLRSKYIYDFLKKKNYKVDFVILSKKFNKEKIYDLILLDLPNKYYNIRSIIKNFSKPGTKVIGLDYNLKTKIDYNISIFLKSKYATKNYIGLKYAIIRKEILNNKTEINKDLFFISIGSSDIKNIRKKILNLFKPFFSDLFVSEKLRIKNNYIRQKKYLKSMTSCILAASNSGTTLLELLFLKKIVFTYPQNILELKFAHFLKKNGYKIFINKFDITKKNIIKLVGFKQNNRLIDQHGANRISTIISDIYNEKKFD
jgi:spore coat polysaccharide biosynthesis predicted glycosyltransferase SpsG